MTIWSPTLDRSKPLYLAIADAIARDVEGGTLAKGDQLPPQRDLAWKLGVTLGTVTRAYKEAEMRGLLTGEVGRGSYIKQGQAMSPITSASDDIIDLSNAVPPAIVTSQEFDAALHAIMRDPLKLEMLDYGPSEGFALHRTMAKNWLKRSGIDASINEIVITAGAHLGLITVLEAITEPGEKVMAEHVNYALLSTTFKNAHVESLPLEMDEEGLDLVSFEAAAKSGASRLVYIVPSLQNPTTSSMSRSRREAIVAIARKYDITIIEDDCFRLLDARVQPPTLYSLAPERTYHVTSLSKSLAPGLRFGFVLSPLGQERNMKAHMRTMAARTVGLTGEIARYWIETGAADEILSRIRQELSARREIFISLFKDKTFRCEQGALYAWLQLPEHWTAARFTTALLAKRVKVSPGSLFNLTSKGTSHHVRICFGAPDAMWKIRSALETIHGLLDQPDEDDYTPVA
jgi:DNA-binding transcriptional MocR family regulator